MQYCYRWNQFTWEGLTDNVTKYRKNIGVTSSFTHLFIDISVYLIFVVQLNSEYLYRAFGIIRCMPFTHYNIEPTDQQVWSSGQVVKVSACPPRSCRFEPYKEVTTTILHYHYDTSTGWFQEVKSKVSFSSSVTKIKSSCWYC